MLVASISKVSIRKDQPTMCTELAPLGYYPKETGWLHPKLKWAITFAYAWDLIDGKSTQRVVDRFELWSD